MELKSTASSQVHGLTLTLKYVTDRALVRGERPLFKGQKPVLVLKYVTIWSSRFPIPTVPFDYKREPL